MRTAVSWLVSSKLHEMYVPLPRIRHLDRKTCPQFGEAPGPQFKDPPLGGGSLTQLAAPMWPEHLPLPLLPGPVAGLTCPEPLWTRAEGDSMSPPGPSQFSVHSCCLVVGGHAVPRILSISELVFWGPL